MKPVTRYILIVGEVLVALAMLVASGVIMSVGPLLAGIPCVMLAFAAGFFAFRDVKALATKPVAQAASAMVDDEDYKYTIFINGVEYGVDDDYITMEEIIDLHYGDRANKKCLSVVWTSPSGSSGHIKTDVSSFCSNVTISIVDEMSFTLVVAGEDESVSE